MKKIMYILVLFILLSACSEDSTSPYIEASNKDELIPLKVGNTWTYKGETYHGMDTVFEKYTITVNEEVIYKNEKHFRLKYNFNDTLNETSPWYYINKQDGHYIILDSGNNNPQFIKINYPTFKGDILEEDETYKFYVEDMEYIYTTPIGKFKCIKYVHEGFADGYPLHKTIYYYAPGIGQIAVEDYSGNMNNPEISYTPFMKSVISSYSLK